MKLCIRCKENKEETFFSKNKKNKDGLNNTCKSCRNEISIKSYNKNKEKILIKNKELNKTEQRKKYKKEWYLNFKQEYPEIYKERVKKSLTKDSYKKYKQEWYQKNKEKIKNYNKERRNNNIKLKITHNISGAILKSLKKNKLSEHWENLIGYKYEDLIKYLITTLPNGFCLEDYNNKKLHIDHIIPINFFNYNSFEDENFKKCWNYRNLRFATSFENLSKGDKIDKVLILRYGIIDLLPKEVLFEDL